MNAVSASIADFRRLDELAGIKSPVHSIDPRAKLFVTMAFIISIVSFNRYETVAILPFFLFPAVTIAVSTIPLRFIVGKTALVVMFALIIAAFNPVFDRVMLVEVSGVAISGGWLSLLSVLLRAMLTASAAFTLVATTGFSSICDALGWFGMPRPFVRQLLFMYRYLFLLGDEAARLTLARQVRSFGRKGMGLTPFSSIIGHMILRSWERAERVYMAMLCRGFSGGVTGKTCWASGQSDLTYVIVWISIFMVMRCFNLPLMLGDAVMAAFGG